MTTALVCLLVCDSWGIGGAPDADAYEDEGANTLSHVAQAVGGLAAPNLAALGLGLVAEVQGVAAAAAAGSAYGALIEVSAGKDTTTGHWEMAGLMLDRPFVVYPQGFPREVIEPFEAKIGRKVLGNVPASGTAILEGLGEEHLRTGRPIVYTSADSVFQVACHTDVVQLETLYAWCEIARELLQEPHAVGRVIARPFDGIPGAFRRRPERRDFSLEPPGRTLLDGCSEADVPVHAVGKIADIFCGRGIASSVRTNDDADGIDRTIELCAKRGPSLVFSNLVDFDSKFGHRDDAVGYARAIESLDARIPDLLEAVGDGFLFMTGDHGCDPTTPGTDHTRERTPLLVHGRTGPALDLGVRRGFGSIGATIAELLNVPFVGSSGDSFADALVS